MKTFFVLFKTALNINFGISALKYRFTKEKKRLWEPILIGASALIGIGALMVMIYLVLLGVFMAGKAIGKPELILTLSFVVGQFVILFFGVFLIMGTFYFGKDLNILVPLPLKPSQVLGSKFAVVMFNEYLILALFIIPALCIYGIGTGQGFLYWLKGIVVFAALPAIPLILGALFVLLLMRFVNVRRNKDLFAIVGGFLGLLVTIGINFFFQSMPKGSEDEFLNNILSAQSKIIEIIGQKFPPSLWATYGLSRPGIEGLGYMGLFIAVSILLFILLMWIGNQVFYKSFISGQEIARKRKNISRGIKSGDIYKEASPVKALFLKEWKLFLRTPIYLMNGIAGMVITPFLLIMPFVAEKNTGEKIFEYIGDPKYALFVSLGGLGLMLFAANINIIANTSVSREGQMFWISKMIPVSPKEQVLGKVLHCIAVEAIGIAITSVVLLSVMRISLARVIAIVILGILGSLLITVLNLMVDVVRPKLEWTNPQEAVKRNLNGVIGMFLTMLIIGVISAIALLLVFLGLSEWLVYAILGLVIAGFSVPSVMGLFALAEYRYSKLEV